MTQEVFTSEELITSAFFMIGELGVQETATASMLARGLELINAILNGLSAIDVQIPYLTTLNFNFTPIF